MLSDDQIRVGSALSESEQAKAKARFVHRFTREHRPAWIAGGMSGPGMTRIPYPVQFDSDADWLAHTWFAVNKDGTLCDGFDCYSIPTFPDHPEHRPKLARSVAA